MITKFDPTQPSRGLGDTIAKITHYTGIAKAVEVVTEALGIEDCGCGARQEWANNFKPYESNSPPIYNPSDYSAAELGVYEVMHQINATKGGQEFEFVPGDRIWMTEEHLLYSDWPYYILIGAVKKTI
jgi:hypothetical protein